MDNIQRFNAGDVLVSPSLVQLAGVGLGVGEASFLFEYLDDVSRFIEIIILHETPVLPLFTRFHESGLLPLTKHYDDIKSIIKEPLESDYWQHEDKEWDEPLLTCMSYASTNGLSLIHSQDSVNLLSWVYGEDFANEIANEIVKMNEGSQASIAKRLLREVQTLSEETIDDRNSIVSRQYFTLDVPIMFNYIIDRVCYVKDIIPVALETRNLREVRAFRNQLTLLDTAVKVGDDQSVISIVDELRGKLEELKTEINQPTLGLQIGFPPSIAINPSAIWQRVTAIRKPHLLFMEQLYKSSTQSRSIMRKLSKFS